MSRRLLLLASDCHTHLVLLGFQALISLLLYPIPASQSLGPHPPCSSVGLIKQPGTVAQKPQEQALTVVSEGGGGAAQDHSLPSKPCRKQPPAPGGVGTAYRAQEGLSQSPQAQCTLASVHWNWAAGCPFQGEQPHQPWGPSVRVPWGHSNKWAPSWQLKTTEVDSLLIQYPWGRGPSRPACLLPEDLGRVPLTEALLWGLLKSLGLWPHYPQPL